jgi:hypothetical protein
MNTPATANSQSTSFIPSESDCIAHIKAHLAKAEKAEEKAFQHYGAAGSYLGWLKAKHDQRGGSWAEWEQLLKDKVGIGKSRASELMAIADGRKTPEEIRSDRRERDDRAYLLRRGGEKEIQLQPPEARPTQEARAASVDRVVKEVERAILAKHEHDPNHLVESLARSTPESRLAAVTALSSGAHSHRFEQVRDAVSDLYTRLMTVGRQ